MLTFIVLIAMSVFFVTNTSLLFFSVNNSAYSSVFLFLIVLITYVFIIEKEKLTSAMFIFNCTVFIFLGGRFISHFILGDAWEIFDLNFMTKFKSNEFESSRVFSIVFSFIVFSNFSYFILTKNKNKPYTLIGGSTKKSSNTILLLLLTVIFLCLCKDQLDLYLITKSNGYLSRYSGHQSSAYKAGDTILTTLFYVFIGICFSKKSSVLQKTSCFYLLVIGLLNAIGGQRGPFIVSLLFIIWFIGLTKDIGIKKLAFFAIASSLLLVFIMSFTVRGDKYSDFGIINGMAVFLYHQGVTLSVINYGISELFDKYPIYPYITSFIPGGARLSTIINGGPLMPYELGFGAFTAHAANPAEYANGRGTGWSIIGNFYLFSGGVIAIFFIISSAFGVAMRYLESSAKTSNFHLGLLACILPPLFFSARAEFKTVFTTTIIYFATYLVYVSFIKLIRNIKLAS
nr:O-antigen polysaccharide polymerase Wzy [Morganella morganii]